MDTKLFEPLNFALKTLKASGMWQDGNQTWFYFIAGHILRFVFMEGSFVVMIVAVDTHNFQNLIKSSVFLACQIVLLIKSYNFLFKIKHIQGMFRNLLDLLKFTSDERFKPRNHIETNVAFGLQVYKAFWVVGSANCLISFIKSIETHQLPFIAWFPFDTEDSEVGFWVASVYSTFGSLVLIVVDVTLDMLPVIFLTFAVGLSDELSERLSQIGEVRDTEKEFKKCVIIHRKVKRFVDEIGANFSTTIFVQGFMTPLSYVSASLQCQR
jgi:hypothetical protein